jgi:glycosyltransferase involved in cell wall biosynthesis
MKKVLLVAYYFPPQPKAGALRPSYLARHLFEFGWEPTVLTVDYPGDPPDGARVIRTAEFGRRPPVSATPKPPAPEARRKSRVEMLLRDALKAVVHFPDDKAGWLLSARRRALALTANERFDAVLSTLPPPSAHFVAREVAVRRNLPWLADYRDLWAGPRGPYFEREFGEMRRRVYYACERWLLRRADALTAASEGHGKALAEYFRRSDVEVIPNACDLSAWDGVADSGPVRFSLCYTGKLYPRLRTPDVLFAAVARLRAGGDPAGNALHFDFYGEDPDMVIESANRYQIADAVTVHGEVSRGEALRAQRAAAVLVLLLDISGEDSIEVNNPGSKVLEYAGARRPILALGSPRNTIAPLMRRSGLGIYVCTEVECAQSIAQLYADYRAGKFEPVLSPDWHPPGPRDLARQFAAVLDRIARVR